MGRTQRPTAPGGPTTPGAGTRTRGGSDLREMLGLAAAAQVSQLPAWFGIALVFGLRDSAGATAEERAATFGVNVAVIVAASCVTYAFFGVRGRALPSPGKGDASRRRPAGSASAPEPVGVMPPAAPEVGREW